MAKLGTGNRLVAIDGLRGLFAAIVVALHYQSWFELGLSEPWVSVLDKGAIYAVCGFFVISGAGMTVSSQRKPLTNTQSVAAFYIRRFFRIAPLYYLVLAIHIAGRCFTGDACTTDPALLLANLTFVFGFGQAALNSEVVAGWSIGIEWIFYFAFPILFVFTVRSWRWVVGLLFASLSALVAWDLWYVASGEFYWPLYAQFPAYLIYFTVGMLIGMLATPDNRTKWSGYAWPLFLAGLAAYGIFDVVDTRPYSASVDVAGPLAWVFGALTCVVVGACTFMPIKTQWGFWAAETAGNLSYGIYLLHFPVFMGIGRLGLTGATGAAAGVACTIILAAIVYYCLERPMVWIGARASEAVMSFRSTRASAA